MADIEGSKGSKDPSITDDREKSQTSDSMTSPSDEESNDEVKDGRLPKYIKGWRLHVITVALSLALFLTNLEIPIVTTSIVGITNDLRGFKQSSWLTVAYLLTYVGFLIIWAKLSDIFGRKLLAIVAALIFIIFSGACGAAQTITQLYVWPSPLNQNTIVTIYSIIFRAFQGVGGSGIYAVNMACFFELVPPESFPAYASFMSLVYAVSLLLGPIVGGVLNDAGAWRWIFLLNVPAGVLSVALVCLFLPNAFPNHHLPAYEGRSLRHSLDLKTLKQVDFAGCFLLFSATIVLVAAVEEAGTAYPWKSAFVITLLILSGLLWIVFLVWEKFVTAAEERTQCQPVFPFRFVQSRIWIGMMLNAFFLGAPFFVAIFQIPQRSQIVNGVSPLMSGVRLLAFSVASPVGSVISSIVAGKAKISPIYLVLGASCLQVIGFALLSTLPASSVTSKAQYGYEVIAGFGCGVNISTLMLLTPYSVQKRDQAVALGTVAQFRVMGGAIGLAVVTSILNSYITGRLTSVLTSEQVEALLQTPSALGDLSQESLGLVREVFAKGYNIQFKILAGLAAAQIPSSLIMWQREQIKV